MEALSTLKFLVIDDSRHMRAIVRVLLEALGAQAIHECDDSNEALAAFRDTAPDMVVVAHHMRPISGVDFTRIIRRSPMSPFPQVPILLVTSRLEQRRLQEARDAGVTEILVKPLSAHDLHARIEAILKRPRSFIYSKSYCGPCRRRMRDSEYTGTERRKAVAHPDADRPAELVPASRGKVLSA